MSLSKIQCMPTPKSSPKDDDFELTSPGQRTGEGAGSVLPYLHDSIATKPGELFPADHYSEHRPARTLAGRVRRAILTIKKKKK
jgi:hypothetical protein